MKNRKRLRPKFEPKLVTLLTAPGVRALSGLMDPILARVVNALARVGKPGRPTIAESNPALVQAATEWRAGGLTLTEVGARLQAALSGISPDEAKVRYQNDKRSLSKLAKRYLRAGSFPTGRA